MTPRDAGRRGSGRARFGHHATCVDHLPDIARQGLVPNDGSRGFWPDGYVVVGRLFWRRTLSGARFYADAVDRNAGPAAILRFPEPPGSRRDLLTDSGCGRWGVEAVPPGAIEIETADGWRPLADTGAWQKG